MKKKNNKGFVGVDMTIAVLAMMIFSVLIISLIYGNHRENIKIKREALAIVYLTEILENIGIADYEEVNAENISTFIPSELEENNYEATIEISSDLELSNGKDEQIGKKVKVNILYEVGDKDYKYTMERIKIKE